MKIQGTPTEIHEKSREINEIDEKRQTRKSNNDHWEPDRPEIEKVNKRFKKKMIGFGRPDEIEKNGPGKRPPHAASKNIPNQTHINENRSNSNQNR